MTLRAKPIACCSPRCAVQGFAIVEVGGLYKVVPEADAKLQTGTVSVGEVSRRGDQVITQIFRLSYENANNLVPVLRPLISPNNTINANPGNNSLVITDYADNLQRIGKIIAAMDTPSGGDVEVVALQYAVASDVAALVQRLSDTGAAPGVPGAAASGAPSILVDQRSNSLIVRTSNPARMASVRSLIAKLDQPLQGSATGNIWVVHLKMPMRPGSPPCCARRSLPPAGPDRRRQRARRCRRARRPVANLATRPGPRPRRRHRSRLRRRRRPAASSRPTRRPTRSSSPRPSRSTARCGR